MTDDNQTPAEVDPFEHAANELLYGDPTSAAKVLRDAVMHGLRRRKPTRRARVFSDVRLQPQLDFGRF